jgi:hypothetical protein
MMDVHRLWLAWVSSLSVSDFKHIYLAGFGLIVTGALTLLVAQLLAVWGNKQPGDNISAIMWNLNIPGFLYFTAAGAIVSFIVGLTLHFWSGGRWGL